MKNCSLCLSALFAVALLVPTRTVAQTPPIETPSPQTACDCHDLEAAQARISRMDATLKDWQNLARYREANTKITPPAKNENRVVFMGDSITDMWAQPQFGGFFPGK